MDLDNKDIEVLNEMYEESLIKRLDINNVQKIYEYLLGKGIYYAKDIFIEYLDLFLLDSNEFISKFDKIIEKLGSNYVDIIGENSSILEDFYN